MQESIADTVESMHTQWNRRRGSGISAPVDLVFSKNLGQILRELKARLGVAPKGLLHNHLEGAFRVT